MKTIKWLGMEYEVVEEIGLSNYVRLTTMRKLTDYEASILQIVWTPAFITEDFIAVNQDTLWQFVRPSKGNFVTQILPDNIRKVVGE